MISSQSVSQFAMLQTVLCWVDPIWRLAIHRKHNKPGKVLIPPLIKQRWRYLSPEGNQRQVLAEIATGSLRFIRLINSKYDASATQSILVWLDAYDVGAAHKAKMQYFGLLSLKGYRTALKTLKIYITGLHQPVAPPPIPWIRHVARIFVYEMNRLCHYCNVIQFN